MRDGHSGRRDGGNGVDSDGGTTTRSVIAVSPDRANAGWQRGRLIWFILRRPFYGVSRLAQSSRSLSQDQQPESGIADRIDNSLGESDVENSVDDDNNSGDSQLTVYGARRYIGGSDANDTEHPSATTFGPTALPSSSNNNRDDGEQPGAPGIWPRTRSVFQSAANNSRTIGMAFVSHLSHWNNQLRETVPWIGTSSRPNTATYVNPNSTSGESIAASTTNSNQQPTAIAIHGGSSDRTSRTANNGSPEREVTIPSEDAAGDDPTFQQLLMLSGLFCGPVMFFIGELEPQHCYTRTT